MHSVTNNTSTCSGISRYLYTDEIQLTVQTATPILAAARKYCVDNLVNTCETFLGDITAPDDACLVYEHAHVYAEERLKENCLSLISRINGSGLRSASFLELCFDCVKNITESDDLSVDEIEVFHAVMRWSEAECKRQELEVTEVNRREVLGVILCNVRFPVIDEKYLIQDVSLEEILTAEEYRKIVQCQQYNKEEKENNSEQDHNELNTFYNTKRRKQKVLEKEKFERVLRLSAKRPCPSSVGIFSSFGGSAHTVDSHEAISFICNADFWLHGICLYGDGRFSDKVTIAVYADDRSIYKQEHTIPTSEIGNVQFTDMFMIKREEIVTITLHGVCGNGYSGANGKTTVPFHHAQIQFQNAHSDYKSEHTGTTHGHIPGLLLSV